MAGPTPSVPNSWPGTRRTTQARNTSHNMGLERVQQHESLRCSTPWALGTSLNISLEHIPLERRRTCPRIAAPTTSQSAEQVLQHGPGTRRTTRARNTSHNMGLEHVLQHESVQCSTPWALGPSPNMNLEHILLERRRTCSRMSAPTTYFGASIWARLERVLEYLPRPRKGLLFLCMAGGRN